MNNTAIYTVTGTSNPRSREAEGNKIRETENASWLSELASTSLKSHARTRRQLVTLCVLYMLFYCSVTSPIRIYVRVPPLPLPRPLPAEFCPLALVGCHCPDFESGSVVSLLHMLKRDAPRYRYRSIFPYLDASCPRVLCISIHAYSLIHGTTTP